MPSGMTFFVFIGEGGRDDTVNPGVAASTKYYSCVSTNGSVTVKIAPAPTFSTSMLPL